MVILKELFTAIESFYFHGKPRHVSCPNVSAFKRLAVQDEDILPPHKLREDFSNKFLVTRKTTPPSAPTEKANSTDGFNERQLNKAVPIHKLVSIHDHSIEEDENNPMAREVEGTLSQVLEEHKKGDNGKILNVLDIKRDGAIEEHPLFSDVQAYRETEDFPLPFDGFTFPVHDHAWWLVATKDARHGWHIDPSGLCTYIHVVAGLKLWAVAVPPPGSKKTPLVFFGDLTRFFKKWVQDQANGERWRIEAVLLRPGDTL
jgi:hypothetical protein